MAKHSIDSFRRAAARRLRLNQTDAEARLWQRLRHWPLEGTHFRRQVPIGPYVADFACMAARLVIELDGSQHAQGTQLLHDQERTRWLEGAGYRVIRFWNNDLVDNMEGVLESIYAAVHGSSTAEPNPLKHTRRSRLQSGSPHPGAHPAPNSPHGKRPARRPSPSRGG